jgi:flagella basal body P-ring formation protein FlgA
LLFIASLWLTWGGPVAAAPVQDHQSIQEAARRHVLKQLSNTREGVTLSVGRLDSRLQLARCKTPLKTFSPPGKRRSAKQTIGVRCSGEQPWTLYVPVTVRVQKMVLVASRGLPRGSIIGADDIRIEERDIKRLHRGYLSDPERVLGKTLKRTVQENSVILPGQVALPRAIKRGSEVVILGTSGALTVRMTGKALASGSKGDRIRVLNKSSKRKVEAIIIAPGVVQVTL